MKIFKLIFILMWILKANNAEDISDFSLSLQADNDDNNDGDDVEGRQLRQIQLYTNDARCSAIGVCSGLDYGDKNVVVKFDYKLEILLSGRASYEFREPKMYLALTFINSKFTNFPLQLFYSFKVQELDFRNCSVETLKWDNFISADNLSILLLSDNLLQEIEPSVFSLAENLSFLLLDSNRIRKLHNDSFKGLEKLSFLDLHNNLIETLPLEIFYYMPIVQQINLAQNRLKIVENKLFESNNHLFSINLQQNALNMIQDHAFQNQDNLKYLDISHNKDLEVLVAGNMAVENLWAKNCSLKRVNVYGSAVHVDLQQNLIKELYFSQPEYLESLLLKDNALEQISSLYRSSNLKILDLSNNPDLQNIPDLMQINLLERLDLSNTSLKEIPASALASSNNLRSLNVSNNRIEEINPLNFKYLEKLSHIYINNNNWNCYNLKMLMDAVIKPLKISYTFDIYDNNFPGEYINGIKCMYRIEQTEQNEYSMELLNFEPFEDTHSNQQEYNQIKFENVKEVEKLMRELKAIVGIYEQKFALVFNKLNEIDVLLKEFEQFNATMWQGVAILV